jgi:hypothetical protein
LNIFLRVIEGSGIQNDIFYRFYGPILLEFTVLDRLMIIFKIFSNSANQGKGTKILFSDWLFQVLFENITIS